MVGAGVHAAASGALYGPSSGIDTLSDTVVTFDGTQWVFFALDRTELQRGREALPS
jgi:hypothetical protein